MSNHQQGIKSALHDDSEATKASYICNNEYFLNHLIFRSEHHTCPVMLTDGTLKTPVIVQFT